jgi:hypothetical protein
VSNVENLNKKFIKESLLTLRSLLGTDIKIVPHESYFKKKIYTEKINKTTAHYSLTELPFVNYVSKQIFVKLYVEINQPTNIKIVSNKKTVEQNLKEFTGWPKVGKEHVLGIVLNLSKNKHFSLAYKANKKLKFKKIEVLEMKDFK